MNIVFTILIIFIVVIIVIFANGYYKTKNPAAYAGPLAKAFLKTYQNVLNDVPGINKIDAYRLTVERRPGWQGRSSEVVGSGSDFVTIVQSVAEYEYCNISGISHSDLILYHNDYLNGMRKEIERIIPNNL